MLKYGTNTIGKLYFGSNAINKAYYGSNLVFQVGGGGTTYAVVLNLTHCTSSNSATRVAENAPYTTTISADSGYNISSVVVMMGSSDITSQCYDSSTGAISIASVTGALSITCVAQSAVNLDLAFNRIHINGQTGHAPFGFRVSDKSLSPLIECKAGDSVTFSANTTTTANGHLCFFDEDFVFLSYYGSNANPRTVTIPASGYSANTKYIALCMNTTNFASSYITNNTTGDSWDGSTYPASKIMDVEDFPAMSPLARNIDFAIGEKVVYGWNSGGATTINYANFTLYYYPTMWTQIGVNKGSYVPDTFFSPDIDISELGVNASGKHSLTFYAGGNTGSILRLFDDSAEYANYYSMQASPRTADVGTRYNRVQIFAPASLIADCYVKDALTDTVLWSGANEL